MCNRFVPTRQGVTRYYHINVYYNDIAAVRVSADRRRPLRVGTYTYVIL